MFFFFFFFFFFYDLFILYYYYKYKFLISGVNLIDVEDWKRNTAYQDYTVKDLTIIYFWKVSTLAIIIYIYIIYYIFLNIKYNI